MPFSYSALGYMVADLQKRIHAYFNTLPDNYWVYLISPIYSIFFVKVLIVVAIWVTLSMLCLCWMQGHAADDTCICHNMGLRKMRRIAVADSSKKGPLLARRFSSVSSDSTPTMATPSRSRSPTHSDSQQSWNSYSSSLSIGFSRNVASSSRATIWDSSYSGDTSACSSEALLSGNPSSSCIITLAGSLAMPESSTTRSFRDGSSSTADLSYTSVTPRQPKEASPEPQAIDDIYGISDPDLPTTAIDAPATETYIIVPMTCSSELPDVISPAISAPPRGLASSQTLSVSRIMAEADHSLIMDESLDDLVVPPTPTPCPLSFRQAITRVAPEPSVQPISVSSSASSGIQITVTAPEQNESPAQVAATPKPTDTATPTPKIQHLTAITASTMLITPGRGRGPTFLPLPPTPVEEVKRSVPKAPLVDSTNTASRMQQREKHWRKKKSHATQLTADAPAHSAGAPNWAAAPGGNVPLIMRMQSQAEATPSTARRSHPHFQAASTPMKRQQSHSALAPQPLLKRIKAEPPTERSLLERLQVAPTPAKVQVKPTVVKIEPESSSSVPKPKSVAPNWAALVAIENAQASSRTASINTRPSRPLSDTPSRMETKSGRGGASEDGGYRGRGKHRIVTERGRWKRGTWPSKGPFTSSTRQFRKDTPEGLS